MTDLIKRDPFMRMFSWPRWIDDYDDLGSQKGLKIHETDKNIIVEAVVAGIPAKDVEVDIEDGVLTIKGEASDEEKKKGEYKFSETKYYYTVPLTGGKWDKAKAESKNGVLKITIPKTAAGRPKKISVQAREE